MPVTIAAVTVGASLKYMIQAPPVAAAIASQAACLRPLRTTFSRVSGALSRRMRAPRSPSIWRSTHMNRSVQTVCGQVKPHHTRPATLVARNRPNAPSISRNVR
ncbi:MAG: hypothetical protein K0S35_1874 [Geminicoccaceae bacterium]|nr:hypothetical protein [Geminicoccaceae bacterium]